MIHTASFYITFSTPAEQIQALRLQSLGTANSFAVAVPGLPSRMPSGLHSVYAPTELTSASMVIGIATEEISSAFMNDLRFSRNPEGLRIFASPRIAMSLEPHYPAAVIRVGDPIAGITAGFTSPSDSPVLKLNHPNPAVRAFLLLAAGMIELSLVAR